jgi:transglutaminase-like putative cysteine protease
MHSSYNDVMRKLLIIGLLTLLAACASPAVVVPDADPIPNGVSLGETRRYLVRQHLALSNVGAGQPEKQNLWVALIRDLQPYQQVRRREITPDSYVLLTDEYGNLYAEFDLSRHAPGETLELTIETEVEVSEVIYTWSGCEGELVDEFRRAELHIESANPQIVSLSRELAAGKQTVCEQVRAFYDYVAENLVYSTNTDDWGAQATFGTMGADCSEFTSLMMALSRAAGIPARYSAGLRYLRADEAVKIPLEHAWLEVYFPEIGWVAMDPTLGRSPVKREAYFAHFTPDRIVVTLGRNPSTLRGANYWSHLYWPGNSTTIVVENADWEIGLLP